MRYLVFVLIFLQWWAGPVLAVNDKGFSSTVENQAAKEFDFHSPFVASGCRWSVPASSLTLVAEACEAYVREGSFLTLANQDVATAITLPAVDGIHWLALRAKTTASPAGWTAIFGAHFLHQQLATEPVPIDGVLIVTKVTVATFITVVENFAYRSIADAERREHNVLNWGATADSGNDDTANFQDAITAAQLSGLHVFVPCGSYGTVGVNDNMALHISKDHFTLAGNGGCSELTTTANATTPICIGPDPACPINQTTTPVRYVTIRDIGITGTGVFENFPLRFGRGILASNTNDTKVLNNTINDMSMLGIDMNPGGSGSGFGGIGRSYHEIRGNHLDNNFFQGIAFNGAGSHGKIIDNTVSNSTGSVDSNCIQATGHAIIQGNTCFNMTGAGILHGEGNAYATTIIQGNLIKGTGLDGIKAQFHGPVLIDGNTVINAIGGNAGISVASGTDGGAGLNVAVSDGVISNNLIVNSFTYGIFSSAENTIITGNKIIHVIAPTQVGVTEDIDFIEASTASLAGVHIIADGNTVIGNSMTRTQFGITAALTVARGTFVIGANNIAALTTGSFAWTNTVGTPAFTIGLPESISAGLRWAHVTSSGTFPVAGYYQRGDVSDRTEPISAGPPGFVNVSHQETTLTTAPVSSNTFDVVSAAGMAVGDNISIVTAANQSLVVQSTITVIATNTLTIAVSITAGIGDIVRTDKWVGKAVLQ